MSDALAQRPRSAAARSAGPAPRPIPLGYGLLAGATVSIGLWAVIIWLLKQAFG